MCMYAHNVETRIARARARVCVLYICMYVRIYVCVYVSTLYCRISAWRHRGNLKKMCVCILYFYSGAWLPWKSEVCVFI